jgi:hypothetical protein
MTDGVTPRCVFCRKPVDLGGHMARLDAGQPVIDLMHDALPGAEFRAIVKCEACRVDPERAWELVDDVAPDELIARMMGRA